MSARVCTRAWYHIRVCVCARVGGCMSVSIVCMYSLCECVSVCPLHSQKKEFKMLPPTKTN